MAYPHGYEAMLRRAVRRLDGRDPRRKDLRGLARPAQATLLLESGHLDMTTDSTDSTSDLDVADFATFHAAVAEILRRATIDAHTIFGQAGWELIEPAPLEAVTNALTNRILDLIRYRVHVGSPVETVPKGIVPRTLRDLAGGPDGFDPHGSGFSEIGAVAYQEVGGRTLYEWVHGFFGEPKDPDPEHLYLSGSVYVTPQAVDGRYVGDHPGCCCFNLPQVYQL